MKSSPSLMLTPAQSSHPANIHASSLSSLPIVTAMSLCPGLKSSMRYPLHLLYDQTATSLALHARISPIIASTPSQRPLLASVFPWNSGNGNLSKLYFCKTLSQHATVVSVTQHTPSRSQTVAFLPRFYHPPSLPITIICFHATRISVVDWTCNGQGRSDDVHVTLRDPAPLLCSSPAIPSAISLGLPVLGYTSPQLSLAADWIVGMKRDLETSYIISLTRDLSTLR